MPVCLFCRRDKARTNEHIIPRIVARILRCVPPPTIVRPRVVVHDPTLRRRWMSKDIDVKISAVCKTCNERFFNKLQAPVEPFLESAITGSAYELNSDHRKALAAWCYKTALLIPLASTSRTDWPQAIVDSCGRFYHQPRPPIGTRVWAGRYDLATSYPGLLSRVDYAGVTVRRRNVMYYGTQILLMVGYLILTSVFWNGAAPDELPGEPQQFPPAEFIRIWPVDPGIVTWPPNHALSYADLPRLSTTR